MYENLKYKINYGYVNCVQDIFHNLHSLWTFRILTYCRIYNSFHIRQIIKIINKL